MTLVVPAVLGGLAIAVMTLVSLSASRRARIAAARPHPASQVRVLIHAINDDRCTGCDACVAVCPTNVLDLVENKSRVLRFQDCIQCEACMWACPTTALVMHPEGTAPPTLKMPELDEFYQTKVPGQYLIGEVAGKPLVKNAANLGRAVVEHMIASGLRTLGGRAGQGTFDVAIVGSGPGGLAAALSCQQRGLSYVLLEKDSLLASTIARYPKGKLIMAEPYDSVNVSLLPVFDSSKEETIPIWKELIERAGVNVRMSEAVERVQRGHDGLFDVRTNVAAYKAQRVVLATGTRGKPRTLKVPGENMAKVQSLLEDPDLHRGQTVCVVGGGDSALEAAIALADAGAKVILSYRGRQFSRAQPKNRQTIESYQAQRRIKIKYQSEVVEFTEDTVTLQTTDGVQKRYPNQAAFVLIGADPPIEWLATLGVHFVERPHMWSLPKSDDLVRRFVPDAIECPENAAGAAALVAGHELSDELKKRPVVAESRAKRFIRSATGMFSGNKLERPMPLSEFAKQARRHSGRGRRDQLDPRERTRVLRMLRDEGGRVADEDSKIYVLDRGGRETGLRSLEPAAGSPAPSAWPPAGPVAGYPDAGGRRRPPPTTLPPSALTVPGALADDPVRTIPPMGPSHPRSDSPKPAVIVGLARAAQQGPRAGRRRRSAPPPVPVQEVPTRQLDADDARRLMNRLEADRQQQHMAEDAPTDFSPMQEELLVSDEEEATRAVRIDRHGHPVAARDREDWPAPSSEATRQVGFDELNQLVHNSEPAPHRPRPPAPPPGGVAQGRPGRHGQPRRHDDATRSVDIRAESLSDVDWDLE